MITDDKAVEHLKSYYSRSIYVPELEARAKIIGIYISGNGLQFHVQYFHNGDSKSCYLFRNEIQIKETNNVGD